MSYRGKLMPYTYVSCEILEGFQSNCLPLSDISILSIPNRHMMSQTKSIILWAVIVGTTSASGHLKKILHSYYHESLLSHSLWEWTQDVYPSLRKWLGARYAWLRRDHAINGIDKPLADIASFDKFFCFSFDRRPIVPLLKNLVCQCVCSFVDLVDSLMYLPDYSAYFFQAHAS